MKGIMGPAPNFTKNQIFKTAKNLNSNFDFSSKLIYNIYVKMRKENTLRTQNKGEHYDKERNVCRYS